ncbi:GHKL domain-containing protein [Flavobacteriaceae bacterium Ap0902]|nr:GHKL domain-containing protein [Flavobacteriaceae bacterium Ap0902]
MIKKSFFNTLIVLMTFSIIGLITVQIYWLNQAFESGKNEFNSRILKALDETATTVNENELNQYYDLFNETRKTLQEQRDSLEVITSQIESDSANVKYVFLTRYMMDKIKLPVSGIYNDSLKVTELYASERRIKLQKDSSIKSFQPIPVNLESEFRDASYSLERFARFDAGNKPISHRVNMETLDSIFQLNLDKWKIDTPFELAILGADSSTIAMESKRYIKEAKNHFTPLFRDDQNQPSYFLSAYLPEQNKAIFSNISALFGVTILFTLIILGIYIASIYAMMRQRKVSQMKTDFMNNMTHEFKTPIATISVASDALKNKLISSNPEKVVHYAKLIKQENKRMNHQVEMVLRMSKLEKNQIRLERSKTHVNEIVKESVESIRLIVENRNGTIFENIHADRDELLVDRFHLGNIVLNVLENANKYSPETPQITVETYNVNDFYVIKISDEGIGMAKNVVGKIFDKFYREETGNIHNVKGHGLGLAYVKHVIHLHGGQVDVESEKGKGSTFYLKIPII